MRLLNPSFGEVVDRLTILELKLKRAPNQKHFLAEAKSLREYVSKMRNALASLENFKNLTDSLRGVNARIWEYNESAELQEHPYKEVVELNEGRASLVHLLNQLWEETPAEKL